MSEEVNPEEKKRKRFMMILNEMVQTEQSYLSQLTTFTDVCSNTIATVFSYLFSSVI